MSKLGGVFLLLGPEEGTKSQYVDDLKKKLTKKHGEEPEISKFYAHDVLLIDLIARLRNGSLFAEHILVTLDNVETITKKADIRLLIQYVKNPSLHTTFLLVSRTVNEIDKSIRAAVPKENTVIFWEMFENQKLGWIMSYFQRKRIQVETVVAHTLLEMVENNTQELKTICEKLALFYGDGARIETEDIEKYVYHSREENVFSLFAKIAQRDFSASLAILDTIFLAGDAEPSQILSGILWQFRKLLSFKRFLINNYNTGEAFKRIGVTSKGIQRRYLAAHKSYNRTEIESIITLVYEFDLRVRSFRSDLQKLLLELFLYYSVVRGGRGFWQQSEVKFL